MASGGRAKRFRGNHTHGRGKKAGRGAGLKGGRGRAGANKHRFLMLQITGGKHPHMAARKWGRIGFKPKNSPPAAVTLNVGDLTQRFPGVKEVDLTGAGYGKLLGSGRLAAPLTIKVEAASAGAVEKVKAAGGKLLLPAAPTPPAVPAGAGKPGAPGPGKPAAAKPAGAPPPGAKSDSKGAPKGPKAGAGA
ncbi:MAG TPA: uL15m family ribosomal protein [Candidatus Thermoplasmatota archaeon]|nr:uL15m family ribosomal protein [Candidatus Thermoplasmatota archaeon]